MLIALCISIGPIYLSVCLFVCLPIRSYLLLFETVPESRKQTVRAQEYDKIVGEEKELIAMDLWCYQVVPS